MLHGDPTFAMIHMDAGVVDDLVDEGRRMLLIQIQQQDSVERRAAELLRLSVATLGGIVVVSGLFVTSSIPIPLPALWGFAGAVVCASVAAFLLARLLVGRPKHAAFAYGPNLRMALHQLRGTNAPRAMFRHSLVEAMPGWLLDNDLTLARQRAVKVRALAWLAGSVLLVLAALFYMLGGHILG